MAEEFIFEGNTYRDKTSSKKYDIKGGAGNIIRKNVEDQGRDEFVIALDIILKNGAKVGRAKPELADELLKIRDDAPFLHDRPNPVYLAGAMIVWDILGRESPSYFQDQENGEAINDAMTEILNTIKALLDSSKQRNDNGQLGKEGEKDKEQLTLYRTTIMVSANVLSTTFK